MPRPRERAQGLEAPPPEAEGQEPSLGGAPVGGLEPPAAPPAGAQSRSAIRGRPRNLTRYATAAAELVGERRL